MRGLYTGGTLVVGLVVGFEVGLVVVGCVALPEGVVVEEGGGVAVGALAGVFGVGEGVGRCIRPAHCCWGVMLHMFRSDDVLHSVEGRVQRRVWYSMYRIGEGVPPITCACWVRYTQPTYHTTCLFTHQ